MFRCALVMLIFSSSLLASCVSTDTNGQGKSKFHISDTHSISPAMKEEWVVKMQGNLDQGKEILGADIETLVRGKVLNGITRDGDRVVLEFAGKGEKSGKYKNFYRTKLTVEDEITDQYKGEWWRSENLVCGRLKELDDNELKCYRVFQFETHYLFEDLMKRQQYRFTILGGFNPKDNQRRFSPSKPEEQDTWSTAEKMGHAVGYSEICNKFFGSGASPKILLAYKKKYGRESDYAKSYAEWNHIYGADYVTGLTGCDKLKKAMTEYYQKFLKN